MPGRRISVALLLWLSVPQAVAVGSIGGGDEALLELHKSAGPVIADSDGTYRAEFEILLRNSGTTKLYELQVLDAIAQQ
ncbi:MAG: hypothetical protein KDI31_18685, partial [Pseudomonadales bacterium]|nr:hypothetical protein [Pseudomonadales bacterium]